MPRPMNSNCNGKTCNWPGGPCPIWKNIALFERKWALRIIRELQRNETQFNELKRQLGITASVLSQRLKELEEEGIVTRSTTNAYSLNSQFLSLLECWQKPGPNVIRH